MSLLDKAVNVVGKGKKKTHWLPAFLYPYKISVLGSIPESPCLSVCPSVCNIKRVNQNLENFKKKVKFSKFDLILLTCGLNYTFQFFFNAS